MSGDSRARASSLCAAHRSLAALHDDFAPGEEGDRVARLRREAWACFDEAGLPTRRLEAWKGTSLARLEAMELSGPGLAAEGSTPISLSGATQTTRLAETAAELIFVDGRIVPELSSTDALPSGCQLLGLAEALRGEADGLEERLGALTDVKRQPLVALQTAFLDDGVVLSIDPNVTLEAPIALRFLSSGRTNDEAASACFPRILVVAGEGSRASLFQEHRSIGHAPGLTACVAEIHVGRSARIDHVQVQDESPARVHFTSVHARLARDARLDTHVFTLGSGLVRSELEVVLAEPGAETRLRGFSLGRGEGHVDHYTTVDHAAHHCSSDEEYRGVYGDRSRGVFRGRVIVRPNAQKTDARQSNPNLLISDRATVDTKPQLEIYADDVRASHGSTIGQLDPDALFFLRARGIAEDTARLLLTRGFAETIVDSIAHETIRAGVAALTDTELAEAGRAGA